MKKYFIFSDVHSFYSELIEALEEKEFDINNPDHIVISLGDIFDRGDQSKECLEFITNLLKQNRAICIKGNHEDLLEMCFDRKAFESHDEHNGTIKTFEQLCDSYTTDEELIEKVSRNEDLKLYLSSCKDYYELGDNVFVHGWIPLSKNGTYKKSWRKSSQKAWEHARWLNGMLWWFYGVVEPNKTIYCGHFHSSWGNSRIHHDGVERMKRIETIYIDSETGRTEPHVNYNTFIDDGIRCLDACTVISHQVNVEVIEL